MKSKLCILLHQIGPYHHARLNALAQIFDVLVIEIRAKSTEYYWTNLNHGECNYRVFRAQGKNEILNIYSQNEIDFFLTYGWNESEYLFTVLYAKQRSKLVFTCSDTIYSKKKRLWVLELFKSLIIKSFDGFLVAGKQSKDYILRYDKKAIIETPFDVIDNSAFKIPVDWKVKTHKILCVARFIREKNLLELIDGYAQYHACSRNKLSLEIVGDGELKGQICARIHSLKLGEYVSVISWVDNKEMPRLLHSAQCLILPSVSETWGLVVNEAMAAGLPVLVSSKCGCASDLVKHNENGFVFEPTKDSVSDVLNAFAELSESQKKMMGQKSEQIIAQYSLENHATAMVRLLQSSNSSSLSMAQRLLLFAFIFRR